MQSPGAGGWEPGRGAGAAARRGLALRGDLVLLGMALASGALWRASTLVRPPAARSAAVASPNSFQGGGVGAEPGFLATGSISGNLDFSVFPCWQILGFQILGNVIDAYAARGQFLSAGQWDSVPCVGRGRGDKLAPAADRGQR